MIQQQKRSLIMNLQVLTSLSAIFTLIFAPFLPWIDVQIPETWEGDTGLEDQTLLTTDVIISYFVFISALGLIVVTVDCFNPILPSFSSLNRKDTVSALIIICIGLSIGVCLFALLGIGGFAEYQGLIDEKNAFFSRIGGKANFQLGIGFYLCLIGILLTGSVLFLHYKFSNN